MLSEDEAKRAPTALVSPICSKAIADCRRTARSSALTSFFSLETAFLSFASPAIRAAAVLTTALVSSNEMYASFKAASDPILPKINVPDARVISSADDNKFFLIAAIALSPASTSFCVALSATKILLSITNLVSSSRVNLSISIFRPHGSSIFSVSTFLIL